MTAVTMSGRKQRLFAERGVIHRTQTPSHSTNTKMANKIMLRRRQRWRGRRPPDRSHAYDDDN